MGKISEELKPTLYSRKFILEARQLVKPEFKILTKGKVLLSISNDTLNNLHLKPGDQIMIPWVPEKINEPLNPFQFSYREYMNQLQVEQQLKVSALQVRIMGHDAGIRAKAWQLREDLISNLKSLEFGNDELAVFQALILGQRRDISEKIYKDYAAAGAIHILAISGLHIGILLVLLNFLLKSLENIKHGKLLKAVLIILLLWSFAFLTGLSASVVRAVCMFSFLAIGLQLKRKTSSLNSLFLSLFFLLLINPYYIFQIGFQLSYLAVFSIIIFQPLIYGIFKPEFKLIDYFWKLTSVSLAAQIGVIPLSIFYFHQFPGLFLVTNLVILPFLGLILIAGITVILMASIKFLPNFLEEAFSHLLKTLNIFINRIAEFDAFVISNIKLNLFQTLSLYVIVLSLIFIIKKLNFYRLSFLLFSILLFQVVSIYSRMNIPDQEWIVFHRSKQSVLAEKNGNRIVFYSDSLMNADLMADYLREREIKNIEFRKLPDILSFSEKLTLVIDTSKNYSLPSFNPDILILRNSPRINLERLLKLYSPGQVIADGSNYNSYIRKWRSTSQKQKIPFHYTGEKGAYILNSN